jgi:hypothetical protein
MQFGFHGLLRRLEEHQCKIYFQDGLFEAMIHS